MMNFKGFWKGGLWPNRGTILGFADGTEKNIKILIRIFGIPAEIQV
jgi:hypothetical protein